MEHFILLFCIMNQVHVNKIIAQNISRIFLLALNFCPIENPAEYFSFYLSVTLIDKGLVAAILVASFLSGRKNINFFWNFFSI